ncbi:MAG: HAD hydrolase family protein [Selenomonadaceae bacterium]|nr:HAD hydrolase family protein [Selenomonadaceae bacterium]
MEWQAEDAFARAKKIKCIIFDVDGVLTDGTIAVGERGESVKKFFCRDGLGITLCRKCGLKTAIITGRTSPITAYRVQELKIDALHQGCMDKREAYSALKQEFSLPDEAFAYIGDDLIDLPVMLQVGLPTAVGDAAVEAKQAAKLIASFPGGRGAAREIIEFILKAQGFWEKILADYRG